jgi:general secretion pathway protein F
MSCFSRLMAIQLQQHTPLPESLRLAAKGLRDAYLARACCKVAIDIEQGRSLSESIARKKRFSSDLVPFVKLGEQTSTLPESFKSAAEMFEDRANIQGKNLKVFLLPSAVIVTTIFTVVFIFGLLMPLLLMGSHHLTG